MVALPPRLAFLWCHPPAVSDGIDPITGNTQVLDDDEKHPGALCREHCENWATYNRINDGSDPARLDGCEVSWGCQAWTWRPSENEHGTCHFYMFSQDQIGAKSWDEKLEDCEDCISGFVDNHDTSQEELSTMNLDSTFMV